MSDHPLLIHLFAAAFDGDVSTDDIYEQAEPGDLDAAEAFLAAHPEYQEELPFPGDGTVSGDDYEHHLETDDGAKALQAVVDLFA